jgi:hypothetical protein
LTKTEKFLFIGIFLVMLTAIVMLDAAVILHQPPVHAQIGLGVFYQQDFPAANTWTVLGSVSHLQSCAFTLQIWDISRPPVLYHIEADYSCNPVTFDVVVTFAIPQSGKLIVIP